MGRPGCFQVPQFVVFYVVGFMSVTEESGSSISPVVHCVGLTADAAAHVLDAAQGSGLNFQQHPTSDALLKNVGPSATGCVLLACDEASSTSLSAVSRLRCHFFSMPVIAVVENGSMSHAVELMHSGVYSVLTQPLEYRRLTGTVTVAVENSVRERAGFDQCREAAFRMKAATAKELEVLQLIMRGLKNKEIAAELNLTIRAVEDRRFRLMKKIGVESVAELVALAVTARYHEQGLTPGSGRSASEAGTSRCVRGVEIWVPDESESRLVLEHGCYRNAAQFREASTSMSFQRGQGLPGRVWEQRTPVFLRELISTEFLRSHEAGAAGMTTAVGFPVFREGEVRAVVLLLLDGREHVRAALECWRLHPATSMLTLFSGTFINCERLRRLSEFVHLPRGAGLSGSAAEQGRPQIFTRLADDPTAVRGGAFAAEQLVSAVALPLMDSGMSAPDVLLLLNSESGPMFSLMQVWRREPGGQQLQLVQEACGGVSSLMSQISEVGQSGDGCIVDQCQRRRLPVLMENGTASEGVRRTPGTAAPSFAIAIPTMNEGQVDAVTVLGSHSP
ncbi:MAG: GAF domain-containing protein [Planctomycetaceae bacterium]